MAKYELEPRVKRKKHSNAWCYPVMVLCIIVYILPIYVLLNMSFRDITDLASKLFLPKVWNFDNYAQAFKAKDLWAGYKNSIILAAITTVLEIVISAMAAYGLARRGGKVAGAFREFNIMIMMIPGIALLVGTYGLMVNLGLVNSLTGLAFLSAAGGIPGCIFMYVNFVISIPSALDEAAAIDGASVMRTFLQIILPQLKAVTVTRIIMCATGSWNNYLMPMFLLQDKAKSTIILVIKQAFNAGNGVANIPLASATCALGLLPVIVVYLLLQRYIIEGQIDSAVK